METRLCASARTSARAIRRKLPETFRAPVAPGSGIGGPRPCQSGSDGVLSRDAAVGVLKDVLARGTFRLRCQRMQPVGTRDGTRPHYEVLLTVLHGKRRCVVPQRFVLAAERCGLMAIIDEWVLATTLRWLAQHRSVMSKVARLSVNLSGQSLDDPHLAERVAALIERSRVPPAWLTFEITETAPLADLAQAAATVGALQALGARVCVDDFGCGYAGDLYVRSLRPDMVKFETRLLHSDGAIEDTGIASWIRSYCARNGVGTVAECVEDRAALPLLRSMGVDYAQGFAVETPFWLDALS